MSYNKMHSGFNSRLLLVLVFVFSLMDVAKAQQLSDTLKVVEIRGKHIQDSLRNKKELFANSQYQQQIDTGLLKFYQQQDIGQVLAQQSPVFIKSYGVNSMATLSLRGASAAQSTVLWNGIPVNNPALGMADLSLMRTGLFSQVKLQYGSSAALMGSGNVGGALLLQNKIPSFSHESAYGLSTAIGSFGRRDIAADVAWQNKKWSVAANAFGQIAKNNFSYVTNSGQSVPLTNAALQASGILASVAYNLGNSWSASKYHKIYADVWAQQYYREIPPALFETMSLKQQTDNSVRTVLGWEKQSKRTLFYFKTSFSNEHLKYADSVTSTFSNNTMQQYFQEAGAQYTLPFDEQKWINTQTLLVFLPWQYTSAKGTNIKANNYQSKPAIGLAYRLTAFKKLQANIALRQEWLNGMAIPFLPGAGLRWYLLQNDSAAVSIQANVQRTYRIPSLNELYYFPGGNEQLKPEQGWSQDVGYAINRTLGAWSVAHDFNVFNRHIQDWIYWLGGAIWTPYNIAKVHSRGLETSAKGSWSAQDFLVSTSVHYAYILSTATASYLPGDGSIGKQIPYAPRYNAIANISFGWKRILLNYNHTYTGYRFITVDESLYLLPYQTGNVQLSYTLQKADYALQIAAQVHNIWNLEYMVVAGRPMPGRNFLFQLRLSKSK